jgi:hypothetical protein
MTVKQSQAHFRLALLLLPLWCCTPALAQDAPGPARSLLPQNNLIEEQEEADQRTRISRREASEIARESFPGRVLSIRLDNRHWRVRMDQEGTVFNVLVDAESGSAARAQD